MPAFCRSCGQQIKNADGSDNFDRQFCLPPAECAKNFRRDQLRAKRKQTQQRKRCSKCVQPILTKDQWKELRSLAAKAGLTI